MRFVTFGTISSENGDWRLLLSVSDLPRRRHLLRISKRRARRFLFEWVGGVGSSLVMKFLHQVCGKKRMTLSWSLQGAMMTTEPHSTLPSSIAIVRNRAKHSWKNAARTEMDHLSRFRRKMESFMQILSNEAAKTLVAINEEVPIDDAINILSIVNEGDEDDKVWSGEDVLLMQQRYREGVYDAGLATQGYLTADSTAFTLTSARGEGPACRLREQRQRVRMGEPG